MWLVQFLVGWARLFPLPRRRERWRRGRQPPCPTPSPRNNMVSRTRPRPCRTAGPTDATTGRAAPAKGALPWRPPRTYTPGVGARGGHASNTYSSCKSGLSLRPGDIPSPGSSRITVLTVAVPGDSLCDGTASGSPCWDARLSNASRRCPQRGGNGRHRQSPAPPGL